MEALLAYFKKQAAQQEQLEAQELKLAELAYKHGLATPSQVVLLLDAVRAGCHE